MRWLLARPNERFACRRMALLRGSIVYAGNFPFVSPAISIWLRETAVTDDDLSLLDSMPQIQGVELGYTAISDAGIDKLALHPSIEYLFVWGTRITDRCIASLSGMQLSMLNVSQTNLTRDGFRSLVTSLPNCLLIHDEFGTVFRGTHIPHVRESNY